MPEPDLPDPLAELPVTAFRAVPVRFSKCHSGVCRTLVTVVDWPEVQLTDGTVRLLTRPEFLTYGERVLGELPWLIALATYDYAMREEMRMVRVPPKRTPDKEPT